ncbi:putative N-acetyl-alpha-D-glucosaminyl L-malate deacetylase 2 [Candidatus Thermoflexus japonica]|uniref:Putative N-acetyl-alpha-D-glucosaminyl L-malate deacetylase 2 n=1 Tax=Candidatus Thermoflexus japonica TaxID=2035417 RepID=A0A2H5Y5P5_9CHLR|nr:putative N-acetyl-alpha-D-glucosaminyl L-malate deacetylase 2 [Candidatus Thermoflexus japonica]
MHAQKLRRMLAVFAHPDDESCLAGGILARCVAEGFEVTLICATRGEQAPSCCLLEPVSPTEMGRIRERELRCAARVLGIQRVHLLELPDGGVKEHQAKLEALLVRFIRGLRPLLVLSFDPEGVTGHPDHIAVGEAVARALEAAGRPTDYPELARAGLRPWRVPLYYQLVHLTRSARQGSIWLVDVSAVLWTKIRALRCHQSQRCCWEPMVHKGDGTALRIEALRIARGRFEDSPLFQRAR